MSPVADAQAIVPALKRLSKQPRVQDFLNRAVQEQRISHAYLFVGAPGSGKIEAALSLAQCIICPQGGDGACDECYRIMRGTHPDVRVIRPEGVGAYLIDQVRDLIAESVLTPVRAASKVYILDRVDLLRDAAANALLKTIEEPPENVYFILCGRSLDACLQTIVSRCQIVPFRIVPEHVNIVQVQEKTGASVGDARIALSLTHSAQHAEEYLRSLPRKASRDLVIKSLLELENDDSWDVLSVANELLKSAGAPLDELRSSQKESLEQNSDFLSAGAMKQMQDAQKRELTAKERSGMMELIAAVESIMRDVLIRCENVDEAIVNSDAEYLVDKLAQRLSSADVMKIFDACQCCADDLAHNVSPQLSFEVMLLKIKEAL